MYLYIVILQYLNINAAGARGRCEPTTGYVLAMATVTGELMEIGTKDVLFDPIGSQVMVLQGCKIVAMGKVDRADRFEIEIPDDLEGELELQVGVLGAAPVLFTAPLDGELLVMINRGGSNFVA